MLTDNLKFCQNKFFTLSSNLIAATLLNTYSLRFSVIAIKFLPFKVQYFFGLSSFLFILLEIFIARLTIYLWLKTGTPKNNKPYQKDCYIRLGKILDALFDYVYKTSVGNWYLLYLMIDKCFRLGHLNILPKTKVFFNKKRSTPVLLPPLVLVAAQFVIVLELILIIPLE